MKQKNILMTGVSRGLGLALTKSLLEKGYTIYGTSRSHSENLEELTWKYPDQLHLYNFDLANLSELKKEIFNQFIPREIPIHGFINNAAVAYNDLITNINLDQLEKTFQINVFAPFLLVNYVIRNMVLHKTAGSLIHLSSISAHTGYKGLAMYASTKGALEAFSKNTAREWGAKGIRSNCIVAGFMETEMSAGYSKEQRRKIYNRTALKKPVNMVSVASTVDLLLTDPCSITGQNLFVDSGTI